MTIVRFLGPIAAATAGVAFVAAAAAHAEPVLPADIYLYTDHGAYDDPSYTDSGNWTNGDVGYYYEGRPGRYALPDVTAPSAQWMLGQTGNYTVQIHWAMSTGHTNDAEFELTSAIGTQTFHINEQQRADQGAPLVGDFNTLNPSYSGWYTLGTAVPLNGSSSIVLTRGAGHSGGILVGNAVRLAAGVDVIVDEQANATVNGTSFASGSAVDRNANAVPNDPISGYAYTLTPDKDAGGGYIEYGLGGVTGDSDVWISWGGHEAHSNNALFVFDGDGDFLTTADQYSETRNLTLMADGTSAGGGNNGIWSGFSYFGQFDLDSASKIRIYNDSGGDAYITGDAFRVVNVVPEPAGLGLLGLGIPLLIRRARRA